MERFDKLLELKRERGNLYFHDLFPYYRQITSVGDSFSVYSPTLSQGFLKTLYTSTGIGNAPVANRIKITSSNNDQFYIHIFSSGTLYDGLIPSFIPFLPYNNNTPAVNRIVIYKTGIRILSAANVYAQRVATMWPDTGNVWFTFRKSENDQYEFSTDDKTFYSINQLFGVSPIWIDSLNNTNISVAVELQNVAGYTSSIAWSSEPKTV